MRRRHRYLPHAIGLAIGIPTRNRADLARMAIESALRAAPESVVVVVSDNSTDPAERRRLESFCAAAPGPVEYVKPPEPLGMTEHWEWLWRSIRDSFAPTHVTYLTDRWVLAPDAVPALTDIAARHPDRVVSYHHDNVEDVESPVQLVQSPWTGRLVELDARRLIALSSRGRYGDYLPRMLNSVVPADVMVAIEHRFGDVFGTVSPDYRFAYRCLAVCDTVLYLDRACSVEHAHHRSAGGTFRRGRESRDAADYAAELSTARFGATPEPALETLANAVFQEYCAVREEAGPERFPAPDRRGYLAANAISVDRIEDPERQVRMRALMRRLGWTRVDSARHAAGLAAEMAGYLARHPTAIRRTLRRQLLERPPGTPLGFMLARVGIEPPVSERYRFTTAAEAIAFDHSHPRPPTPDALHLHRLERAGAVIRYCE